MIMRGESGAVGAASTLPFAAGGASASADDVGVVGGTSLVAGSPGIAHHYQAAIFAAKQSVMLSG
jgi:hypothetical protein